VFEDATMRAIGHMLPIVDDFERALKSKPEGEGPVAEYAKGMELIHQQFVDTLNKLGLKALETEGKEFDPNLHHAVQKVEQPGVETDIVLEEYQRGYFFKEKLLRPAMVKVGVKS
jgi:molecular chaperone GrpE